ncbi:MAG: MFS transporter, partial [Bacteroidota bacterium]
GEAGAFPGIARAVFRWVPVGERGIVNGINFSGGRIGAAIALPGAAWLISQVGWRMSFAILGVIGILWAVVWYAWFRDDPAEHAAVSEQEQKFIEEHTGAKQTTQSTISFSKLFQSKGMWLLMGQYFCSNFTFFFCLTWLFPHLKVKYNLEAIEAGFYSSAPLIFGALGNWFSGWLVDVIYRRGKWSLSRKLPAIIGFALAAIGVLASVYMEDVLGAIIFISLAVFGADMTLSPSWSACVDVGREHSGAVSGTMNMAGNLGSFVTALAFPYLMSLTGSDVTFFYVTAVLNLLAIPIWWVIRSDQPLELHSSD